MKTIFRLILLAIVVGGTSLVFTGCATTEPENLSERPWNSPRGWESGLPSSMNEGR